MTEARRWRREFELLTDEEAVRIVRGMNAVDRAVKAGRRARGLPETEPPPAQLDEKAAAIMGRRK